MKTKIQLLLALLGLMLLNGCIAYTPYPAYAEPAYSSYGYGYSVAPVVPMPVPMFYGGWGRGYYGHGYRGHGHHRH